ncbi:MAG: putative aminophosphonate oxidoreductase [Shewanella sp.]
MSYQSFWFDEACRKQQDQCTPSLVGEVHGDVVIVGGGFTGLWTAIMLKQATPQLKVILIERDRCGAGASGRNGGAMLTWSAKFMALSRDYGVDEAIALVAASESGVGNIAHFCQAHGIDAELRLDGCYYTATNFAQQGAMAKIAACLNAYGINHWQHVDLKKLLAATGSKVHSEGHFNPNAGSVHPGKLVLGLKRLALKIGIQLYEQSAVTQMQLKADFKRIITEHGCAIAPKVVLATNAWLPELVPEFTRNIVLVSSDMVITKSMPEALHRLGLNHGAAVIDMRTFVHYYRTTADGRLMLGKGGNRFSWGNKVRPFFDAASAYEGQLAAKLKWLFDGEQMEIERSWTGASDRSVSGMPFFGELTHSPGVFYGSGYSGNGVVASYLGGEILAALVTGKRSGLAASVLVNGHLGRFPTEPIRFIGANLVRQGIRGGEGREDAGRTALPWQAWLRGIAASAGKA